MDFFFIFSPKFLENSIIQTFVKMDGNGTMETVKICTTILHTVLNIKMFVKYSYKISLFKKNRKSHFMK